MTTPVFVVPPDHIGAEINQSEPIGRLVVVEHKGASALAYVVDGAWCVDGRLSNVWTVRLARQNLTLRRKTTSYCYKGLRAYTGPVAVEIGLVCGEG